MSRRFPKAPSCMSRTEFVDCFGGIYEHSAWVAEQLFDAGITSAHADPTGMANAMASIVDAASRQQRMTLIRAHPDLAGRAAVAGTLTAESTTEQSRAGLDQCSAEEFDRFQSLNDAYKSRFEMPFIKAVRHSNRHEILQAFESRLPNTREVEFENAIREIHQIARWRLEAMIDG
ncbi:MAG: 2-oxo-4-hydroxy-4-carboxy-5-ureidoimidazoline decarboxylase [Pseudomonadota bacterium]